MIRVGVQQWFIELDRSLDLMDCWATGPLECDEDTDSTQILLGHIVKYLVLSCSMACFL